ncbi:reverse transcriptase domain-containing protein [Tanacetum coccineum]
MIDVFNKKISFKVGNETIMFDIEKSMKFSTPEDDECLSVDLIDNVVSDLVKEILPLSTLDSFLFEPILNIQQNSTNLWEEEDNYSEDLDEAGLPSNHDNWEPITPTLFSTNTIEAEKKLNDATQKDYFPLPFIDQMLERLSRNEYYCFLDGFSAYFQIPLAPEDQEKTTFTCLYETFAYRRMPFGLCNALTTFQRCMTAIFHDMCKDFMEVFMDDFFVSGNSFDSFLTNLSKMLERCEETNLVFNWEKCCFVVKEGIVQGHKISKSGIEVDRAKVEAIAKLPYPTNVKGVRSFLGHARFYQRFIKDFSKIARPMTQLLIKDAKFIFSNEWAVLGQRIDNKFRPIYYASKTMNDAQEHYTTPEKELLAVIKDKKGTENLAADHLSRLENPDLKTLNEDAIQDSFPDEYLMAVHVRETSEDP